MKLSVQLGEQLVEVSPIAGDLVHFERQFGEPVSIAMSVEHPRIEHVLFLAWRGLVRTKRYEGTFDDFLEVADMPQESTPVPPPLPPG